MSRVLEHLEALGVLQPVDVALGRLLADKSPRHGEIIGLAAAADQAHRLPQATAHCRHLDALRDF